MTQKSQAPLKSVPPAEKAIAVAPSSTQLQATKLQSESQVTLSNDMIVPRLLLMQGISPLVTTRKAQIGDFIRNSTLETLGGPEKPIEIVPLAMVPTWMNFETKESAGTNKPVYRGTEPRTPLNQLWKWDFEKDGKQMVRKQTVSLYALIPADIAQYAKEVEQSIAAGEVPDLSKSVLPVLITFTSTSFKHAGRKCATFFRDVKKAALDLAGKMEVAPFLYTLPLKAIEEKGKDNTSWWCFDLGTPKRVFSSKATSEEQLKQRAIIEEASRWVVTLGTQNIKTDDTGVDAEEGTSSGGVSSAVEMEV